MFVEMAVDFPGSYTPQGDWLHGVYNPREIDLPGIVNPGSIKPEEYQTLGRF